MNNNQAHDFKDRFIMVIVMGQQSIVASSIVFNVIGEEQINM